MGFLKAVESYAKEKSYEECRHKERSKYIWSKGENWKKKQIKVVTAAESHEWRRLTVIVGEFKPSGRRDIGGPRMR